MKRVFVLLFVAVSMLTVEAFGANGDLIVDGKLGVGNSTPNSSIDVGGSGSPSISFASSYYPPTHYKTQLGVQSGQGVLVLGNNGWNEIRFGNTFPGGYGGIFVNNSMNYDSPSNGILTMFFGTAGNVGIGTDVLPSEYKFVINGSAMANGGYWNASDERYKKNIQPVKNALTSLLKLEGVSYDWKKPEELAATLANNPLAEQVQVNGGEAKVDVRPGMTTPEIKKFPQGRNYGLIAQEIEKVLPELVKTDSSGYKAVNYTGIIPVLIEAIKEQQKQIEKLQAEVGAMKKFSASSN